LANTHPRDNSQFGVPPAVERSAWRGRGLLSCILPLSLALGIVNCADDVENGARRGDDSLNAPPSLRAFHGTDVESARRFLEGAPLDAREAAARKIDGPSGFFLATVLDDAIFFALRRQPGGVLQLDFSAEALQQLLSHGVRQQPIPQGARSPHFLGDELLVPPAVFERFNHLRRSGEIVVSPAQ
jgi:hypothetical protein